MALSLLFPNIYIHPIDKVRRIVNALNGSASISITGAPGSGKSYTAIKLCQMLDENWTVENGIFFDIGSWVKYINESNPPPGTAFLWDEIGVLASSRSWMTDINKNIGYIMQTLRHKNYVVIKTTPHWFFQDIQLRKLDTIMIQMVNIDRNENVARIKWFFLEWSDYREEPYKKYPLVKTNNKLVKLIRLRIPKPDAKTIHAYEKKKAVFTSEVRSKAQAVLNRSDTAMDAAELTPEEIAKQIMQETDWQGKYVTGMRLGKPIVSENKISIEHRLGRLRTARVKYLLQRELEIMRNSHESASV